MFLSLSKPIVLLGMIFILIISALAVIESKYHSRSLFILIQAQEKKLDDYEVEWGQLQLELNMLTEENRVERVAKKRLKLRMPERKKIIYLKP